jgi:hypothetical protein
MIAVIKGDIIASRKLIDQERWLEPLKKLLDSWGSTPQHWELVWGDLFQVEIAKPEEALKKALEIKALIKKIAPIDERKKISTIDVKMAIGIGNKTYTGERISESNGPAFIYAGEKFEELKKSNANIGVKSPWESFDKEFNLYLKLASIFMDSWTVSSAELVQVVFQNPNLKQAEIGKELGIKQSGVSGRWNRAHIDEILEIELAFSHKIRKMLL